METVAVAKPFITSDPAYAWKVSGSLVPSSTSAPLVPLMTSANAGADANSNNPDAGAAIPVVHAYLDSTSHGAPDTVPVCRP